MSKGVERGTIRIQKVTYMRGWNDVRQPNVSSGLDRHSGRSGPTSFRPDFLEVA